MKITIDRLAWLNKSEITSDQLIWLKRTLTITQKVSKEYESRSKPAVVQLFEETEEQIGIPREYFFEKMTKGHDIEYKTSNGAAWPDQELRLYDMEKNQDVTLRDEQSQAMIHTIDALKDKQSAGGLIQAPTAWGKTTFVLALAKELKLKMGVVVHREFLLNQWKKRIARFLPECKVGIISGNKFDIEGCHIVLIMIETIASWVSKGKMKHDISDEFGIIAFDEIHRGGAPTWGKVLGAFNSKYRIGVSAHPRRSDGLDKTFFYHIGKNIFSGTTLMMVPKVRRVWTPYKIDHIRVNPAMLSMEFAFKQMSKNKEYNQAVTDQTKLALTAGRKILVYSHTVDHLKTLKNMLDEQWDGTRKIVSDFYIGGMKEEQLDVSSEADVIFATLQMAKDSLDIPALDTVVLAAPVRNPQQPAGRACREYEGKKEPIVVDMRADNVPVFRSYAESRDQTYARIYNDDYLTKQLVK